MTSTEGQRPERFDVRDPETPGMTDQQLSDYITRWSANLARYEQQARERTEPPQPGGIRPGFSAWWAGKILDRGIRERERRRHHATERPDHNSPRLADAQRASNQ